MVEISAELTMISLLPLNAVSSGNCRFKDVPIFNCSSLCSLVDYMVVITKQTKQSVPKLGLARRILRSPWTVPLLPYCFTF